MAQSLLLGQGPATAIWREDCVYSPTANTDTFAELPPELEFHDTVLTSDGWVDFRGGDFTMRNGGPGNEDAYYPYGGTMTGISGYLLFPRLNWSGVAGLIMYLRTSAAGQVSFALSSSGLPNDKIDVCILPPSGGWQVRDTLTGIYGINWHTRTYAVPAGISALAIVYRTASYTAPAPSPSGTSGQVIYSHRLRVSNLTVTNALNMPMYLAVRPNIRTDSLLDATVVVERFATISSLSDSALVVATVVTPHVDMLTETEFTVASIEAGAELAPTSLLADSSVTALSEIEAFSVSATGGFQVGSRMSVWVESTILPENADLIRPLSTYTILMTRPALVRGWPITPRARSITVVNTAAGGGTVIGRISAYSTTHVYPDVAGGPPTYRWLAIEARRDPDTGECVEWPEHTEQGSGTGPAWSTPGAYRPSINNYVMQTAADHQSINYPAVSFDSTRLDHLNITLDSSDYTTDGPNGQSVTWFLVGSYTRFRGMLRDSCPILDFTADADIDYTVETLADRYNHPAWFDAPGTPTMYTGWHVYGDRQPTISSLGFRVGSMEASSAGLVYTDNAPVVLAICVNGLNSYVRITPIYGTGPSPEVATVSTPREIFTSSNPIPNTVTLGKSRSVPPFNGMFGTGSMSLLEVSFYDRPLSVTDADTISRYLAGVYAPASLYEPRSVNAVTVGKLGPQVAEPTLLFTTNLDADPVYLLDNGRATKFFDYDSYAAMAFVGKLPLAYISTADYASFIENFT